MDLGIVPRHGGSPVDIRPPHEIRGAIRQRHSTETSLEVPLLRDNNPVPQASLDGTTTTHRPETPFYNDRSDADEVLCTLRPQDEAKGYCRRNAKVEPILIRSPGWRSTSYHGMHDSSIKQSHMGIGAVRPEER